MVDFTKLTRQQVGEKLDGLLDLCSRSPAFHVPEAQLLRHHLHEARHALSNMPGADVQVVPEVQAEPPLTGDQQVAWDKLLKWIDSKKPFFVLRGYAGTGKTFLLKKLTKLGTTVFLTAPTNKATKVLSQATGYPAKTTFSFLGLRLTPEEDQLVMEYGKTPPYLPRNSVLVVDEASICGALLVDFLKRVQQDTGCKILFVGDPAQLPPVGETTSPAWRITDDSDCRAVLKKVMRHDNQILSLSMNIREALKSKTYRSPVVDDNDGSEGVFLLDERDFKANIRQVKLDDWSTVKVCAWRNATVDRYNRIVRKSLGFEQPYEAGECVLISSPVEQDDEIVAHIDEEFRVVSCTEGQAVVEGTTVPVHRIAVAGDTKLSLQVPVDQQVLDDILKAKSLAARGGSSAMMRRRLWKEFWDIKNSFHGLRYGYAMTAHRLQGSTLQSIFMDQMDILANRDKRTAMKCLYVGATRPTTQLLTF